jgi:hypothetical protein
VKSAGIKNASWFHYFLKKNDLIARPAGRGNILTNHDGVFDFGELDRRCQMNFYKDRLSIANKIGYEWVSQAIVDLYYNKGHATTEIGIFFEATSQWCHYLLDFLNNAGNTRYRRRRSERVSFDEINTLVKKDFLKNCISAKTEPTWFTLRDYLIEKNKAIHPFIFKKILKQIKHLYDKEANEDNGILI